MSDWERAEAVEVGRVCGFWVFMDSGTERIRWQIGWKVGEKKKVRRCLYLHARRLSGNQDWGERKSLVLSMQKTACLYSNPPSPNFCMLKSYPM